MPKRSGFQSSINEFLTKSNDEILGKVPILSYFFKRYYFEQITGLKNDETCDHFLTNCLCTCLLYTSPSPRDNTTSRMPSSA